MWAAGGVSAEDRLDAADTRRVIRRAITMAGPHRRKAALAIGLLVGWTLTIVAGPLIVGNAIDRGIREGNRSVLNWSVVIYLVVAIVGYLFQRKAIRSLAEFGENFLRDLRNRVFDRLVKQSMRFHDREPTGVLVSRMTSDIDSLGDVVQFGLLMFVSALLQLIVTTIVLTVLS